jgi:hypothetical protein
MTLLIVDGQLCQVPSTGGWWTIEDCGPGLYRYVFSDDPTRDVLAPAGNGRVDSVRPQTRPEEPEALESALGPAGRASQGKDTTKP